MTLERNTHTTCSYIGAPLDVVTRYAGDHASLTEYTLFSRMTERVDDSTWLGTASGYQGSGLYYHVVRRDLGPIQIIEWHCGPSLGAYHHVYVIPIFASSYFGAAEGGAYYHWISWVDPARASPMISQCLLGVHASELRALKAQLERRAGHRRPAVGELVLRDHTIYIEVTREEVTDYIRAPEHIPEWSYPIRHDGTQLFDEYDHPIDVKITRRSVGPYDLVEHDTHYLDIGVVVRAPFFVVPAAYAFGNPEAKGVMLHRVTAWPSSGRRAIGKIDPGDYDTELINAKRFIEGRAGNLTAYGRGPSYVIPQGG